MIRLSFSDRIIGITVAILLAINSGCGAALRTTPIAPRETPYCFAVVDRTGEHHLGCSETRVACERHAGLAKTWASATGLTAVDDCYQLGGM
jgi:hypothetical protein